GGDTAGDRERGWRDASEARTVSTIEPSMRPLQGFFGDRSRFPSRGEASRMPTVKTRALRAGRRRFSRSAALLLAIFLAVAAIPDRCHAIDDQAAYDEYPAGVRTSETGDAVRDVWDVLFWRPIYVVQLVGGVLAFPVAIPIAAVAGNWRDSIDI